MTAYYNDNDPRAAAWLRELIGAGLVAPGVVYEESIENVDTTELARHTQVHLFAGIGGWSHALRLAGWPDDVPVWTGSCPCQPFSVAGKRQGTSDKRHLWPDFRAAIAVCRPPIIFGEQVAGKSGREWLAGVRADLEALGYAVGAADLCAASVGAPHIRQRLFWVAHASPTRLERRACEPGDARQECAATERAGGEPVRVDDAASTRCFSSGQGTESQTWHDTRLCLSGDGCGWRWHPCRDGKSRRIPLEPALFPLAHGLPGRVGLLRGAGNAIVPQVAATFIQAACEAIGIAR